MGLGVTPSKKANPPKEGRKTSTPAKKAVKFGPPRSASKVTTSGKEKKNLKRKEPVSSESEFEEEIVKTTTGGSSRKTVKGRKVPLNVPSAPLDNVSFHFEDGPTRWKFVFNRRLSVERNLSKDFLKCKELMELISAAGLMKTVKALGVCYEKLVKEFLVNIGEDCNDPTSHEFRKVFVRGRCVNFSPSVINQYLGRSIDEIADMGVSQDEVCKTIIGNFVQAWPKKNNLSATRLTAKYALLNKIAAANWVPTTHSNSVATGLARFIYAVGTKTSFAFGSYIFEQTFKHAKSLAHPDICTPADVPCAREADLSFDYRLFEGSHAADIVGPSSKKSADTSSKKQMIADLKETSKALEERKLSLDRVIQALEAEVAEEGGMQGDGASGEQVQVEDSDESTFI
ncbi:uncharacterized protein LOC123886483 [Trifolium pratense]|uniref:uncharacterized protein LOC123886483 n=1 Tax=Trifolium pratense TaxID=57577 RepID=UPI001E693846|nr:uncharacterized protein LOC123886483 [Trifolium pratense]